MRTVLVTGGAGYVGAHCCKAFAQAGWSVVAFDNLTRGNPDAVRWGRLIEGDVLDRAALDSAFLDVGPDLVVHLAGLAYVEESILDPAAYYHTNCIGTLNLLDAMRRAGCTKLIFSGSCATYGVPDVIPIPEDHRQSPINPYGWTKLFAERMIADFADAYDLAFVVLRYFNVAGADAEGEIGESHDPETHLIPLVIEAALSDTTSFSILGIDHATEDGSAVRDYVHVSDVATAHVLAANLVSEKGGKSFLNLGTGGGYSVKEIIAAVEAELGMTVTTIEAPKRAGDPSVLVACARRARETLGWTVPNSNLSNIIRSAFAWHRRKS